MSSPGEATCATLPTYQAVAEQIAADTPPAQVFESVVRGISAALGPHRGRLVDLQAGHCGVVVAAWYAEADGVVSFEFGGTSDYVGLFDTANIAGMRMYQPREDVAVTDATPFGEGTVTATAPILCGASAWGRLFVQPKTPTSSASELEAQLSEYAPLIGAVIAYSRSHLETRLSASEQASLLRVTDLVARDAEPAGVFAAVADELRLGLRTESAALVRFDGTQLLSLTSSSASVCAGDPRSCELDEAANLAALQVRNTSESARAEPTHGRDNGTARPEQVPAPRSAVAVPVLAGDRLWGALVASTRGGPLPRNSEDRMQKFADLIALAIINQEARSAQDMLAKEQEALRRVATGVAREEWATTLPTIVKEVGQLLEVDGALLLRYENAEDATTLAAWGEPDLAAFVGTRLSFAGDNPTASVWRTQVAARQDDWEHSTGLFAQLAREAGIVSVIASPVVVENRLWGVIIVLSAKPQALPPDTEERLGKFGDLVATAIGNMQARLDLLESRIRIVNAADQARRGFERDLHDGIQQRLVSAMMNLNVIPRHPSDTEGTRSEIAAVSEELTTALEGLRELSRGLHPAILSEGGLGPALRSLCRRSSTPAYISAGELPRLPEPIEVGAYYVVSEALANANKHARASRITITVAATDAGVTVTVTDDGIGGARLDGGTGLTGLQDRVEALGGHLSVQSVNGQGSTITASLPPHPPQPPFWE